MDDSIIYETMSIWVVIKIAVSAIMYVPRTRAWNMLEYQELRSKLDTGQEILQGTGNIT